MIKFFTEMRRRNVFRVAATYLVGAWFLVQTAFTLESVMNLPDWFDALFMSLMMLGFPVAVLLAWAFELTPDGFKRTEVVAKGESIAAKTGRKLEYAIIIGLFLVGALMIADRVAPGTKVKTASFANNHSVAVLPFSNRSAEQSDAFFADGMHDELLSRLSKISALEVISRTSVMGYRDTQKRIPDIAQELGVAVILEGAVQRAGDRVRISVQLIDGKNDKHLWAENYDRALTTENIFDIQAEITQVIAAALETIISGEDQTILKAEPTQNLAAYESYMRGRLLARPNGNNAADLRKSVTAYDKAIAADPDYAQAYAGKAYAQMALYWFNGRDASYRDAALSNLDRAKALAPESPETLLAEAFYHYWGFRDFRKADTIFDRALKAAPNNVDALAGKAFIARRLGRFNDAARGLSKAHRLDPLSFYLIPELALTHALIGEFDAANTMIAKAKSLQPDSLQGAAFTAAIRQLQGDAIGAYDAVAGTGTILQQQKMDYALLTRDPEKIETTLKSWPEAGRAPEASPELYNIYKIKSLLIIGKTQEAEAELTALKARIAGHPPSRDWSAKAPYSPVTIPGLLGDLDELHSLAADHAKIETDDAMVSFTQLSYLAEAFARAGAGEKAMDYIDKMRGLTGPHIFPVIRVDPAMDTLRNHPRYLKLKADYEIWAKPDTR